MSPSIVRVPASEAGAGTAGGGPITDDDDLVSLASHDALAERVAVSLRDMVVKGVLRPGDRIVERRLCAELNVSRTPMREALKLLRQDGLVELSRNRGARVLPFSAAEAGDLFDVIAALEAEAAARYCLAASADSRARLEDLHARMLSHWRAGDLGSYFDINSSIHDMIVHDAGNAVLSNSHSRLMLRARRGRYMAIMDVSRLDQAVQEHETLMAALRAGAVDAARAIWRVHLLNTGHAVAKALGDGDALRT